MIELSGCRTSSPRRKPPTGEEEAHRAAVSRLQAAQGERASAIAEVTIEVCADSAGEFTDRLNAALAIEATIRSVLAALNERAARAEPGIGSATEQIACPP